MKYTLTSMLIDGLDLNIAAFQDLANRLIDEKKLPDANVALDMVILLSHSRKRLLDQDAKLKRADALAKAMFSIGEWEVPNALPKGWSAKDWIMDKADRAYIEYQTGSKQPRVGAKVTAKTLRKQQ